jgi:hypothetical protein
MDLACKIIIWLLEDTDELSPGPDDEDSAKLRQLACYLYYSIIKAFIVEMGARAEVELFEQFQKSYDDLGKVIKSKGHLLDTDNTQVNDLSSRTLLELITRIIARKFGPTLSLDQYRDKLEGLRVSKGLRDYRDTKSIDGEKGNRMSPCVQVGLPRLILICIHATNGGGGTNPEHVIATTRETWPSFGNYEGKLKESRKKRLENEPEISRRTEELWTQVQKKLDDILANSCPDKIKNLRVG